MRPNRRRAVWPAIFACTFAGAIGAPVVAQELPVGRIVERVACRADATQTYALYLPSNYSRDRRWPILYAFDARARGIVPVQRFIEGAERYGYIVVGSNNARAGALEPLQQAVRALLADTSNRFTVDAARIYYAGFSAGARFAVVAGLQSDAAGVIGCAAGPLEGIAAAAITIPYFVTVGTDDFNYPEMVQLDHALAAAGVPYAMEVFDGPHDWAPADICTRAIEWMELQAMRTKARPMDAALIDRLLQAAAAEAAAQETTAPARACSRYQALATQFSGLRDVTPYEQKARQLAASRAVQRMLAEERDSIDLQRDTNARLAPLVEAALSGEDRAAAINDLVSRLSLLKSQSAARQNDASRMAARRIMTTWWNEMNNAAVQEMQAGKVDRAAMRFGVMARVRPEDAVVFYNLACAHARTGKKSAALDALERAVKNGFADTALIASDPDLASLRGEDRYARILTSIRK